jgi:hypothetical protein
VEGEEEADANLEKGRASHLATLVLELKSDLLANREAKVGHVGP